jgi:hypothetical protein
VLVLIVFYSPETILVLRSLASVEASYLSKSSIRLNEAIGQAFVGGSRSPPGTNEAVSVARSIANELDSARFDPILVKGVARAVKGALEFILSRVDPLITHDRTAVTLLGPTATTQQMNNAQVASFLWHTRERVARLRADQGHAESTFAIMATALEGLEKEYARIVDPLLSSVRRDVGAIIARVHKLDFGSSMDAHASLGLGMGTAGGGASTYMRDLVDKLSFVKTEIFPFFNIGEARRTW